MNDRFAFRTERKLRLPNPLSPHFDYTIQVSTSEEKVKKKKKRVLRIQQELTTCVSRHLFTEVKSQ